MFRIEYGSGRKYGRFQTRKQAEKCLFRNGWIWFDSKEGRVYGRIEPIGTAEIKKMVK